MAFTRTLAVAAFTALSATFIAPQQLLAAPVVQQTRLPNGLTVVVKEDHRAPSVVHMVWYQVGAMDEVDGSSGLAHALEHMMFKGTPKVGPGRFNQIVAAEGGRDNAFTSLDYTAYFQQVPAKALRKMMTLEADRMRNLRVSEAEFSKEIEVIKEERRMRTDDKPRALVHEQLMASALLAHPYRRPVIGWMNDLDNMTAADAREWYQRWYAPNNATVVIVGDVDARQVINEARQIYGVMPAKVLPQRRPLKEPEQHGIRRVTVKAPADLPYLAMGWRVPRLQVNQPLASQRDVFALEVLAGILDGYDGARLNRDIVRGSQIAVSANAGYDSVSRGEALFMLDGAPAPGHQIAEVEAELRAALRKVAAEGVSAAELQRVKAQLLASEVYKKDSLMGQAMEVGMLAMSGLTLADNERLTELLRSVTADEVQSVAQRYFADDQLTVAVLDPLPVDTTSARKKPAAALRH